MADEEDPGSGNIRSIRITLIHIMLADWVNTGERRVTGDPRIEY
jgi:hypothetical protein